MSLKVFRTTRQVRKGEHLFGIHKPETLATLKRFSRRRARRRSRRELQYPDIRDSE
jgi:hypothetical protein